MLNVSAAKITPVYECSKATKTTAVKITNDDGSITILKPPRNDAELHASAHRAGWIHGASL